MWLRCRVVVADETYVVLSVAGGTTRARVVALSDGRIALWPADDAVADVVADGQALTVRADRPGSAAVPGTAAVVRSGRAFDEARAKLRKKYGWRARLSPPGAILLLHLDAPA